MQVLMLADELNGTQLTFTSLLVFYLWHLCQSQRSARSVVHYVSPGNSYRELTKILPILVIALPISCLQILERWLSECMGLNNANNLAHLLAWDGALCSQSTFAVVNFKITGYNGLYSHFMHVVYAFSHKTKWWWTFAFSINHIFENRCVTEFTRKFNQCG